jgi:hypothetical protein
MEAIKMKFLPTSKRHQNNKKGGMLLLVLVIFGMSLILISSALTITIASRSRYYVDAELSQERLTLISAAETVIDAIENQEITDKMIQGAVNSTLTIRGANTTSPSASAGATSGLNIAPGLAGSTQSSTTCEVSKVDGSEDLYLDFHTIIDVTTLDGNSENLRVRLKYTPPAPTPEICTNMVTTGEDGVMNNSPKLFVNDPRSFTVFHGTANVSNESASSFQNRVVYTGIVKGGQGALYYNDIIFYGPNAGYDIQSTGNGLEIRGNHSFYFLGVPYEGVSGVQHVLRKADGSNATNESGLNMKAHSAYFYNADITINAYTMGNGYCTYMVADSGSNIKINRNWGGNVIINDGATVSANGNTVIQRSALAAGSVEEAEYNNLKFTGADYMANNGEIMKAAGRQVPTSEEMEAYRVSGGEQLASGGYGGAVVTKDGGKNYRMSGTYSTGVMKIDLSKGDCTITMTGNTTFHDFYIQVSNEFDNELKIVLNKGVNFVMDDQCGFVYMGRTCGIVSTQHVSEDWHQAEHQAAVKAVSGTKPAAYILGMGQNFVSAARACVVDAYICLGGRGADASTLELKDNVNFYGRFEAVKVLQGSSDNLNMAYCPGPNDGDTGPKPLTSCYSAEDYQFYYN